MAEVPLILRERRVLYSSSGMATRMADYLETLRMAGLFGKGSDQWGLRLKLESVNKHRSPGKRYNLGCGFPVSFEFPTLPGKPSSVCLATEFA